jgi:hypothetical protein
MDDRREPSRIRAPSTKKPLSPLAGSVELVKREEMEISCGDVLQYKAEMGVRYHDDYGK